MNSLTVFKCLLFLLIEIEYALLLSYVLTLNLLKYWMTLLRLYACDFSNTNSAHECTPVENIRPLTVHLNKSLTFIFNISLFDNDLTETDVTLQLKASEVSGRHVAYFRLKAIGGDEAFFGQLLCADIMVCGTEGSWYTAGDIPSCTAQSPSNARISRLTSTTGYLLNNSRSSRSQRGSERRNERFLRKTFGEIF